MKRITAIVLQIVVLLSMFSFVTIYSAAESTKAMYSAALNITSSGFEAKLPLSLNIRQSPTTNSSLLGTIPYRGNIQVYTDQTEYGNGYTWIKCTYNGITGWVITDYLHDGYAPETIRSGVTFPTEDQLEASVDCVIANINPQGDTCYFNDNNILARDSVKISDCNWDSHEYGHNEFPTGCGKCSQYIGQCTWYAYGRFMEVYGIKFSKAPNAIEWLTMAEANSNKGVKISRDKTKPIPGSVFVKASPGSSFGHVGFVEGVSSDGKYVYYTDANVDIPGSAINLYDSNDGKLRCSTIEYFTRYIKGYIYADRPETPAFKMHVIATSDDEESGVCVPTSLRIRTAPTTESSTLGYMEYRDNVDVFPGSVDADGYTWVKIKYNNQIGYCSLKYLRNGTAPDLNAVARSLSESELEASIGHTPANTNDEKFNATVNPLLPWSQPWYNYGRFMELTDATIANIGNDVNDWLGYTNSPGIVIQMGGSIVFHSIFVTNDGQTGVIEGFSGDGEYVYYFGDSGINKMLSSVFSKKVKGYIYSTMVPAAQVNVSHDYPTLKTGESLQIAATVSPTNASDKTLSWRSNNTDVARVENNGLITAISPGSTTITVSTHNAKETVIYLTVEPAVTLVEEVAIPEKSKQLICGDENLLVSAAVPETATNLALHYTSSNTRVATVTKYGYIQARNPGTTIITVASDDGNAYSECNVNVVKGAIYWSDWVSELPNNIPDELKIEQGDRYRYFENGEWSSWQTIRLDSGLKEESAFFYRYERFVTSGDLNHNTEIEISDAMILFKYIAGKEFDIDIILADLNGDGDVNISDAMILFRTIAGKI